MFFTTTYLAPFIDSYQVRQGIVPDVMNISVDSRTINAGDYFLAIKGERVDGHIFVEDVLKKGVAGIIVATSAYHSLQSLLSEYDPTVYVATVDDPFQALCVMARLWREQFTYPVVAITGSVGKTSTKERLVSLLKMAGRSCLFSRDNQNTLLSIALTIMRMRSTHDVAVLEVGISQIGEMRERIGLLRPTMSVITAIGHSHIEGLGTLEDVAREKREVFSTFDASSIGVINGDCPLLTRVSYEHPVLKFGLKRVNQIRAHKVGYGASGIDFIMNIYQRSYAIQLRTFHEGAVYHVLAASAVGVLLGIDDAIIVQAAREPIEVKGRFLMVPMKEYAGVIVDDCYNASPESMQAALRAFKALPGEGYKIAVLGDMLELGKDTALWHKKLGRLLQKMSGLERVILVGTLTAWTKKTAPIVLPVDHVASWQEAVLLLKKSLDGVQNPMVLIKGSHGIQLDKLVKEFAQ